ncbi:MAG TPA: RecX family transcriptional regulator [Candidatus Bathyarchaeia archaeon]|nr:RecX family transcriptional regulator [Candidatus Bathyarchaeia archaeon]
MIKITQIKPQKGKFRFNIYLDGKFGFALSAEEAVKSRLKVGQELSENQVADLFFKDKLQNLYDQALRFLSFRPRSEKEIRDYLKKKALNIEFRALGFATESNKIKEELIKKVVIDLGKQGLVDDYAFAGWWCRQRAQFRPRGKKMVLAELRQKGVEEKLARKAVDELLDEFLIGQELVVRKFKKSHLLRIANRRERQKIGVYLSRHGFGWQTIRKVIDSFLKKR